MSVREPAVAGTFYKADPEDLRVEIEACFLGAGGPGKLPGAGPRGAGRIVGLISPHAGFIYSGPTAAHGYYRLAENDLPKVAVLLGPNHRGYGAPAAVGTHPAWRTPLGRVELDTAIARGIISSSRFAQEDSSAHQLEHSLEVQLPFLQYITGDSAVRIVPILVGISAWDGDSEAVVRDLGEAVAGALEGQDAIVVASTDFTHYESQQSAQRKDSEAIRRIIELDEMGLLEIVRRMDISMCGVVPTAVSIAACKRLGAKSARELAYRTSGDVTDDYAQVVGYASIELDR